MQETNPVGHAEKVIGRKTIFVSAVMDCTDTDVVRRLILVRQNQQTAVDGTEILSAAVVERSFR